MKIPSETISTQQEAAKFFILHSGDQAWKFSDIHVYNDSIVGEITPLQGHEYYKTNPYKYANRYKVRQGRDESEVINEVHITISEYNAAEGNEISIPLKNIEKIEIYDKDTGTTSFIIALSAVPVIIVLLFLLWISTEPTFS